MKRVILIRHASIFALETGQVSRRSADEGLSAKGRSECFFLKERLANICINVVFSSPAKRALATALAVWDDVRTVNDLGDWQEGETDEQMYWRVSQFFDSLSEGTFAIVTHGSPIAMILCHCIGADPKRQIGFGITPASLSVIQDGVIVAMNDTAHLGQKSEVMIYDKKT